MNLEPLLAASPAIQLHTAAATAALAVAALQVLPSRGSTVHRWTGRLWMVLMALTAGSSLFIHHIQLWGPWSPIHLLSVATLASLVTGIRAARKGRIREHRATMISLVAFALVGAGIFTLLPGRIMNAVLFG
ncbi:MAG: DUF2306 domain-containing protein [Arhodomonas sp.]|nr:DUF2306 domain-containing protein [Arhodomonas sp.]